MPLEASTVVFLRASDFDFAWGNDENVTLKKLTHSSLRENHSFLTETRSSLREHIAGFSVFVLQHSLPSMMTPSGYQ